MRPSRAVAVLAALLVASCGGDKGASGPTSTTSTTEAPAETRLGDRQGVLVAAGDVACAPGKPAEPGLCQMAATAKLVESLDPDAVALLGDLQYENGSKEGFLNSYDKTWGVFKRISYPAVGNHEYGTPNAAGYVAYWGDRAGPAGQFWYSFDIGSWHIVALNSNCKVVGCGQGSDQIAWLEKDLAESDADCTLAFWHHPRYSSGPHGSSVVMGTMWDSLVAGGADVALAGHDHHYERFAPQNGEAQPDPNGMRQFVVGTGGKSLYPRLFRVAQSEKGQSGSYGVLELTLLAKGYEWRFISTEGDYSDSGSAPCSRD